MLLYILPELLHVSTHCSPSTCNKKPTIFGSGRWVLGFLLCERFIDGNLIGSRTKKVGYVIDRQWPFEPLAPKCTTHRVVKHPIQVSFFCVQLHPPSVNISRGIRRATLGSNGRNTKQDISLLANGAQEACGGDVGAVVGAFKEAVCSE